MIEKDRRTQRPAVLTAQLLLLNLGGLAGQITQIIELRTTDFAATEHRNLIKTRGMQREGTLHANAVGNTAEGEGLTDAAVALRDADALEGLQALAIALNNLNALRCTIFNLSIRAASD